MPDLSGNRTRVRVSVCRFLQVTVRSNTVLMAGLPLVGEGLDIGNAETAWELPH